jgi:hypothetical protein
MMYANHFAIYALYPQAVTITDDVGAFDADGQPIELDASLIAAKAAELDLQEEWTALRGKRNEQLLATDFYALVDSTLSEEMRTYRQALRDLPANTADPFNPSWPTKPEAGE